MSSKLSALSKAPKDTPTKDVSKDASKDAPKDAPKESVPGGLVKVVPPYEDAAELDTERNIALRPQPSVRSAYEAWFRKVFPNYDKAAVSLALMTAAVRNAFSVHPLTLSTRPMPRSLHPVT